MLRTCLRLLAVTAVAVVALPLGGRSSVAAEGAPAYQIWPLGDSITYGLTAGGTVNGGYRAPLDAALTAGGTSHVFVGTAIGNGTAGLYAAGEAHHDGHVGYRVDQVATDLIGLAGGASDNGGSWLTGTGSRQPISPDVVVLHLGTNDILQRYDPGVTYPTPDGQVDFRDVAQVRTFVTHLTQRLGAMVERLVALRPGVRIVLSQIAPIESTPYQPATAGFAIGMKALANYEMALHHRVVLADVYDQFVTSTGADRPNLMSTGGIHPTAAGYAAMANVYVTAVTQALALP